jgi:DNA polymerase-1
LRSKTLGLKSLKQVLNGIYKCETQEHLEADDLIGMQATNPDGNEYVIVGNDKDYFTVPGDYINHTKIGEGIQHTTKEQADYNHLVQTLMGDRVDNYFGCPGIGKRKAEQIAVNGWPAVVAAYRDAGKTENDALINARLAYILRHGDMDKKGKPKSWKPQQ